MGWIAVLRLHNFYRLTYPATSVCFISPTGTRESLSRVSKRLPVCRSSIFLQTGFVFFVVKSANDFVFSQGIFSDAMSFHLVNEASVADLNSRLDNPVSARNFRPNIIVAGEKLLPYEEDNWDWVKIGDVVFRVLAPCTR